MDVAVDEAWEDGVAGLGVCGDGGVFGGVGDGADGEDFAILDVHEAGWDGSLTGEDADVAEEEGCHVLFTAGCFGGGVWRLMVNGQARRDSSHPRSRREM